MKTPRWYQLEGVQSVWDYFRAHPDPAKVPLVGLPTGTGKALVIAGLLATALQRHPGTRGMVLSHNAEIVRQDYAELLDLWSNAPAGVHCDDLGRRDTLNPIIFGSMQSVWATIKAKGPDCFGTIHFLQIDECHIVSTNENTTYRKIIHALRQVFPGMRIVGHTATAFRLKQGRLTDAGGIFTDFCYDKTALEDYNQFISEGFLVPHFPRDTETKIDLAGVSLQAGEFNLKELEAVTNVERVTIACVREMIHLAANCFCWLVFCNGIDHAENTADIMNAHGIETAVVHSKRKDNHEVIEAFRARKYRALVNANMLTTGFNVPEIDHIGMLRATNSPTLHVQMLGRGGRPAPGKSSCLVTDFAGNVARLGPINDPVIPGPPGKRKGQAAPVKICQACGVYNHTSARECMACLAPFELQMVLHNQAGTHSVVAGLEETIETWPVDSVHYHEHKGQQGKTTLKVTYCNGARMVSEYVCLEHDRWPKIKARKWWQERSGSREAPATVAMALQVVQHLSKPKAVRVKFTQGQKYPDLISQEF